MKKNEIESVQKKEYVDVVPYSEFRAVNKNNEWYIIGLKNDKWYEVAKSNESIQVIGRYLNRVYCYGSSGLKYIDFENNPKSIKDWIKYKQYQISDSDETGTLYFQKVYLMQDTIYFKYTLDIASGTQGSGIMSLNVNASSMDDSKQIISDVKFGEWYLDKNDKSIYYLNNNNEIKKYNTDDSKENLILSDVRSFEFNNDKIIFLKINNEYRETGNSVVQAATYELRLYDLKNSEERLIYESPLHNVTSGNINGFAQIRENDIYYKSENNIMKYNNGSNEIAFTCKNGQLKEFKYRNDGILKVITDDNRVEYYYDNVEYSGIPYIYEVMMSNGTTQNL